jgi:hypothetical protein
MKRILLVLVTAVIALAGPVLPASAGVHGTGLAVRGGTYIAVPPGDRIDCVLAYAHKFDNEFEPVWGETRSRTSTTCSGQFRTVIHVCLRQVCNSSGFYRGGWIEESNHTLWSRATSGITAASLYRAWFEDRGGPGQTVQCVRFYPSITSAFSCGNGSSP